MAADYATHLRALMAHAPKRDAAMIEQQRESFVYGNLKLEEPGLTREEVRVAMARARTRAK